MEPGIYKDISHKDYHAMKDIISNSYLGRLDKVPAAAKITQEETAAFLFGRAFHCYVLEGIDVYVEQFAIADKVDLRTKAGKEWWATFKENNQHKDVITLDDHETIEKMGNSINAHPFASKLLSEGVPETTLIWQDEETGIMCKARPDHTPDGNKGVLLDLKSTRNASEYAFRSDCVKFGYAREAGIYTEGFARLTGANYKDLIFAFIAVEKDPPYRVEVYTLDVDFLDYGVMDFHRLLKIEKECRDNNFWPNYKNAGAQELQKPSFLKTWEWGE